MSVGLPEMLAALVLLLISLAVLFRGLPGRRLDRQLICRRCRFDLSGLPPGARYCPVCGAGLRRRRASHLGNRAKRKWTVAIAALGLLVSGGFLSTLMIARARHSKTQPFPPFARETGGSIGTTRDAPSGPLGTNIRPMWGSPAPPPPLRVVEPGLRTPMRQAISASPLVHQVPGVWKIELNFSAPPMAISAEAIVRAGGRDYHLMNVTCNAGEISRSDMSFSDAEAPDFQKLRDGAGDLILRPKLFVASPGNSLPKAVWNEEIIIKGIKIQRLDAHF